MGGRWNESDIETDHGARSPPDVVFSSPFVSRLTGDESPCDDRGFDAVRQYVVDSFVRATPGIRYTLDASYAGTDSVVLVYTVHHPDGTDEAGPTHAARRQRPGRRVALPLPVRLIPAL